MVHLTDIQSRALAAVQRAWPDTQIAVVGAVALGAHIELSYRSTDDLDLALAIEMDDFPGRLPGMENWRRHPKMEHRFYGWRAISIVLDCLRIHAVS